jgi:hypothetical protein
MLFQTRCPQCKKTVSAHIIYADKLSLFLSNEADVLAAHTPTGSESDHRWALTIRETENLRKATARILKLRLHSLNGPEWPFHPKSSM